MALWSADLQPTSPGGVKGSLGALVQGGVTQASITLSFGDPGVTYVWRISSGDCASEGALFGGRAVYSALTAGDSGTGEAEASIAGELSSGASYAARIAESSTGGTGQVLACGELRPTN
jgi:hypothetical protein